MNNKEAKHLSEVLKAYSEGKEIEIKNGNDWIALDKDPRFSGQPMSYRIKPEPKYRPYKNAKEFLNAQKEHGPYIDTESWAALGIYTIPYTVNNSRVYWKAGYDLYSNWEELSHYKWQDGTPCKILEE